MASNIIGVYEGKCCDSNIFNENGMHLSRKLFETLFKSDEYKRAIENGHYIGYLGHPEDPNCMDFKDACIVMRDCSIDADGEINGKFDLIDTPVGRIVKAFQDAGVKFGISIRGAGDVDGQGEVDPETFVFRGFDLVTFPAYTDCIPTFREIAASTDINVKKKTKMVEAAIRENLKEITSCGAICQIKEQLADGSDLFNEVSEWEQTLAPNTEDEAVVEPAVSCEEQLEAEREKVKSLTQLYIETLNQLNEVKDELNSRVVEQAGEIVAMKRRLASLKRIAASQLDDIASAKESVEASARTTRTKLRQVAREKEGLQQLNLKYKQKIESTQSLLETKDSTISSLKSKLNETVEASTQAEKRVSNLDATLAGMKQRVEAAEDTILEYQKAFANMYANALGVHLDNIPVTASTSVRELQSIIKGGCNTSGMPAASSVGYQDVEEASEYDDEVVDDDEDIDDDEMSDNGIVTL